MWREPPENRAGDESDGDLCPAGHARGRVRGVRLPGVPAPPAGSQDWLTYGARGGYLGAVLRGETFPLRSKTNSSTIFHRW